MSDAYAKFIQDRNARLARAERDVAMLQLSQSWLESAMRNEYTYNFEWLGRPIIQNPVDIIAMQELIFSVQPDLIIETGIAHGGSLILYASLLELNAMCGGPQHAHVLGVDIDIRQHNRISIESHPIYSRGRITMFEGSSVAPETVTYVHDFAQPYHRIMVLLDSNHTHDHVLLELNSYASLVSVGSYCVVFDTHIERFTYAERPWGKGNNPMTASAAFLHNHEEFEVDVSIDAKLLISVAPKGYLKRVK